MPEQQGVMSAYQLGIHNHQGFGQGGVMNRYGLSFTNPDTIANVLSDHDKISHDALGIETLGSAVTVEEYIYHLGDLDTYIRFQPDEVSHYSGGIRFLHLVEAGTDYLRLLTGLNIIGGTSNAFMGVGLTIDQGAYDNEALALKSSDVAHGVTDYAETDTFAWHQKVNGFTGGHSIHGITEDEIAIRMYGIYTNDNTDKTVNAGAPFQVNVYKKSGTGYGNVGANANIVAFRCRKGGATETLWFLDEDGDTYQYGNLSVGRDNSGIDPTIYFYEGVTARGRLWYDISGDDFVLEALQDDLWLEADGDVASETIRANTTVTACNVQIGTVIGNIKRSTSGRKYKDKIKDLELDSALVYSLRPRSFNSLCKDDDKNKRYIGLIADEVEEFYPEIISYGDKKEVENYDSQMLMTLIIAEMQKIHNRVSALEN